MLVGPGAGVGAGVVDGAGSRVWLAETRSAGAGAKAQLAGAPAPARTSARFCSILAASSLFLLIITPHARMTAPVIEVDFRRDCCREKLKSLRQRNRLEEQDYDCLRLKDLRLKN